MKTFILGFIVCLSILVIQLNFRVLPTPIDTQCSDLAEVRQEAYTLLSKTVDAFTLITVREVMTGKLSDNDLIAKGLAEKLLEEQSRTLHTTTKLMRECDCDIPELN